MIKDDRGLPRIIFAAACDVELSTCQVENRHAIKPRFFCFFK